jgi:MFS family permease
MSRVISTLDVAGSLGMALGPFLGGLLKGLLGFKYMTWTWSKSYQIWNFHY